MTIVIATIHRENFESYLYCDHHMHEYIWVKNASEFADFAAAGGFIDFNEESADYRGIQKPLLVNQTAQTLQKVNANGSSTGRFCGWPGFADRSAWEVATSIDDAKEGLQQLLAAIGKQAIFTADIPGLIAPRILAGIINEACYAIDEGISDAAQVDTAMKLGTNYPEGPIAWGKKVGAKKIWQLLTNLAIGQEIYVPHPSLLKLLD